MGIIAFDVNQTWDYSLTEDVSDPKTVFHLGHLDSALATHLRDSVTDYKLNEQGDRAGFALNARQTDRDYVRFGVKGWDNLKTADGRIVAPKLKEHAVGGRVGTRRGLADESLDYLIPYFFELARAIEEGNKLTETETKNS